MANDPWSQIPDASQPAPSAQVSSSEWDAIPDAAQGSSVGTPKVSQQALPKGYLKYTLPSGQETYANQEGAVRVDQEHIDANPAWKARGTKPGWYEQRPGNKFANKGHVNTLAPVKLDEQVEAEQAKAEAESKKGFLRKQGEGVLEMAKDLATPSKWKEWIAPEGWAKAPSNAALGMIKGATNVLTGTGQFAANVQGYTAQGLGALVIAAANGFKGMGFNKVGDIVDKTGKVVAKAGEDFRGAVNKQVSDLNAGLENDFRNKYGIEPGKFASFATEMILPGKAIGKAVKGVQAGAAMLGGKTAKVAASTVGKGLIEGGVGGAAFTATTPKEVGEDGSYAKAFGEEAASNALLGTGMHLGTVAGAKGVGKALDVAGAAKAAIQKPVKPIVGDNGADVHAHAQDVISSHFTRTQNKLSSAYKAALSEEGGKPIAPDRFLNEAENIKAEVSKSLSPNKTKAIKEIDSAIEQFQSGEMTVANAHELSKELGKIAYESGFKNAVTGDSASGLDAAHAKRLKQAIDKSMDEAVSTTPEYEAFKKAREAGDVWLEEPEGSSVGTPKLQAAKDAWKSERAPQVSKETGGRILRNFTQAADPTAKRGAILNAGEKASKNFFNMLDDESRAAIRDMHLQEIWDTATSEKTGSVAKAAELLEKRKASLDSFFPEGSPERAKLQQVEDAITWSKRFGKAGTLATAGAISAIPGAGTTMHIGSAILGTGAFSHGGPSNYFAKAAFKALNSPQGTAFMQEMSNPHKLSIELPKMVQRGIDTFLGKLDPADPKLAKKIEAFNVQHAPEIKKAGLELPKARPWEVERAKAALEVKPEGESKIGIAESVVPEERGLPVKGYEGEALPLEPTPAFREKLPVSESPEIALDKEGYNPARHEGLPLPTEKTGIELNTPEVKNAIQEQSSAGLLQRQQEEVGKARSKRGRVEQVEQREEIAPKGEKGKIEIKDSSSYQGKRQGSLMGPNDEHMVAVDPETGKEIGRLWVTKVDGGFEVRKVETDPSARGKGVARQLYMEAHQRYGTYKGATDQTPMGKAFNKRLRETNPEIFEEPVTHKESAAFESNSKGEKGKVDVTSHAGQDDFAMQTFEKRKRADIGDLAFVPDMIRDMIDAGMSLEDAQAAVIRQASQGKIQLQVEAGIDLLKPEDARLAPKNKFADNRPMTWAQKSSDSPMTKEAPKVTTNASGESSASVEAMHRLKSELAAGQVRMKIDTRSGKVTPLITTDAVDTITNPYEVIVMNRKNSSAKWDILDSHPSVKMDKKAIDERFRTKLNVAKTEVLRGMK